MDYSFIRLEDSLDKAKQIKISPMSSIATNEVIQLLPTDFYLQITNLNTGISFAGDYSVYTIDCNGNTLNDVTSNVFIYEFTDSNGINQIAFELYKLGFDYGKRPIHLKFVHTTGTDVYYSNSFCLSSVDSHKTTRYDCKHNKDFYGISYSVSDFYQSINLVTWYAGLNDETEVGNYYQISKGNTISNRPLRKQSEIYKCELMNDFVFERANILLLHDIIYVNGVRVTNKTTFKSGEFIGDTNTYRTDVTLFKDYKQTYTKVAQIKEPFSATYEPLGLYSLTSALPINAVATFNNNIVSVSNVKIYLDDVLLFDIVPDLTSNTFSFELPTLVLGVYKITFEATNVYGDVLVVNSDEWTFTIANGEYLSTDYDNNEYLIN